MVKPDPMDPYAGISGIRAHPELALIAVLENTLSRMVDVLVATNPEFYLHPRLQERSALQADRLIGRIWELQEALRRYRSCPTNRQDSVSPPVETSPCGADA